MNFNKLPLIVFLLALYGFPFAGFGKDEDKTNTDIKEHKTSITIEGIGTKGYAPGYGYSFKVIVANPVYSDTSYSAGFHLSVNTGSLEVRNDIIRDSTTEIHNANPKPIINDTTSWTFHWSAPKDDSIPLVIKANAVVYKAKGTIAKDGFDTVTVTIPAMQAIGKPIISDVKAYGIHGKEANIEFTLNPNGGRTAYTLDYGETTEYERRIKEYDSLSLNGPSLEYGNYPRRFLQFLYGLKPNTVYHYRIKARNKMGIVYSDDYTFKTRPAVCAPQLYIQNASVYDSGEVAIYADLRPNGSPTKVYIEYGLTEDYGSKVIPQQHPSDTFFGDEIYGNIKGLKPKTLYHYRIVGVNSAGTGYSEDATFTTK